MAKVSLMSLIGSYARLYSSFRKRRYICSCLDEALLIGSGANHAMVPEEITPGTAESARQHYCISCPSNVL